MFKFSRLVSIIMVTTALSSAAFAQAAPPRSVLINTAAFYDDKGGIARLVAAEKQIDTEFAKDIKELRDGSEALAKIAEELQKTTVTEANQAALLAKKAEGESLQRRLELKKADLEALINRKREILIGPITFDIGKAISEFGKKNGYAAIYDASKLAENGVLLFVGDGADITKEFIAYFNAKAAAVPVK